MINPPVVNASPLIHLAKGGYFELLQTAGNKILVPVSVDNEIRRRGPMDVTVKAMGSAAWLTIVDDPLVPNQILSWDLGPGESSVLAWALAHPSTEAILDDRAARRCATVLNIPICGTLGLILRARRKGIISQVRPIFEKLQISGMYTSAKLLNDALALVGE